MNLNLKGVYFHQSGGGQGDEEQGGGRIVNIASVDASSRSLESASTMFPKPVSE